MHYTPAEEEKLRAEIDAAKGITSSEGAVSKAAGPSGSLAAATGSAAEVSISRMTNPEVIRVRLEINREVMDVEMELADFALCLTGRGATIGKLVRRFTRTVLLPNAKAETDGHST